MLKTCVHCQQEKQWDPAFLNRKASGFHGAYCWPCFLASVPQKPEYQAQYRAAYRTKRYHNDPLFAARCRLSTMACYAIQRLAAGMPLRDATTEKVFGCTVVQLKAHIEHQFVDDMSWANYGVWELDHIIPLASAKTMDELLSLYRMSNTQVLVRIKNRQKAAA